MNTPGEMAHAENEREVLVTRDTIAIKLKLAELAKADFALQRMIDALAAMPNIDNFIPAALQIVAETFDTKNCSYYEHRLGDLIRLRYWCFNDHVYSSEEIAHLPDGDFSQMRDLAKGFTVPDSHLGSTVRQRTRACVVDHTRIDPPTIFAEFCKARGWELELNVPLVVAGVAEGALVVVRGAGNYWSPSEISLAERLAQQLALAIEASRLSALAKEAAIAQEREVAARRRADELARYGDVLKQTVDSLVGEEDFLQFIGRLLAIASEQLHAPVVECWRDDGFTRAHLILTCRDGVLYNGSDEGDDVRVKGIDFPPELIGVNALSESRTIRVVDMIEDPVYFEYLESIGMRVREWCRERAVQKVLVIPLLRSNRSIGAFCLYISAERMLDQTEVDLAYSLAQQVSLAVRMTELAEESKHTAVARERVLVAERRTVELSQANEMISATLERLSNERDLPTFSSMILREAMRQTGAHDGAIFVFDPETKSVRATDFALDPESSDELTNALLKPLPAAPEWEVALQHRAPVIFDLVSEGHMLLPGAAEWHRLRGSLCVVNAPIFVNREPYGFFGFAFRKPATNVSKVDLGLIQALSQQVSLAIQLTRLADESKQAVLAQERERAAQEREAELSMANDVLRATLEQLSDERDLGTFPSTILKEAIKQIGANDGAQLIFEAETGLLRATYLVMNPISTEEFIEEVLQPLPAGPGCMAALSHRAPMVFDVEIDTHMFLPETIEWHRNRGNLSTIVAPIFVNSEPYGFLAFALQRPVASISKIDLNLIQALTQQVSLAIQLTRLAEVSQKAAIRLERQQVIVQERSHMAREIHDKLAQGYAAILMQQRAMRRAIPEKSDVLIQQLDIIERLSRENLAEARRTMDDLKSNAFEPGNLYRGISQCMDQWNATTEFVVSLAVETELPPVPRYVETELCRVIGEALSNARRHSRSTAAKVTVQRAHERLTISIKDEGIGFDVYAHGPSFGIPSMHERAARAGANLEITSALGRGTEVCITLGK